MNEEDINNLLYTLEIHHIDGTPVANLLQAYKEQEEVIDEMYGYIDEKTYRDLEECEFSEFYEIKCGDYKSCEQCIKQYFINKVKENKI